jgi:malonate-semialdehyde dehydrogenase (acetylating)/methylmalonate-semialdehyde dehydrogenase
LCEHPGLNAISFVGSTPVAKQVYEMGTRNGKRVQAAGGAKNVLLVMPDAELDSTLRAIMGAAFGCAGQRCMAGSLLMAVGDAVEPVRSELLNAMDALPIGDPLQPEVGMGPVIDDTARERLFRIIDGAAHQGGRLARDGRRGIPATGFFVGPTLIDAVAPESPLFRQEHFGPVLSMAHPRSLDEAIEWLNRLPYGNGASIFTSSGAAAREFARRIHCGMVGVNIGVPAPMALFPFSGWGESFFGDLHVQGMEGVYFYTRQKVVLSRWDAGYFRRQGW